MDPVSIMEDTEQTRMSGWMDRWTDRRMDKMKPIYNLSTSLKQGYVIKAFAMQICVTWEISVVFSDTDISYVKLCRIVKMSNRYQFSHVLFGGPIIDDTERM